MAQCLVCGSENMRARVELFYNVPLSKRGWGVVIGKLSLGKLDVRDSWEKDNLRPINCHDCGAPHIYDVKEKELRLEKGWR